MLTFFGLTTLFLLGARLGFDISFQSGMNHIVRRLHSRGSLWEIFVEYVMIIVIGLAVTAFSLLIWLILHHTEAGGIISKFQGIVILILLLTTGAIALYRIYFKKRTTPLFRFFLMTSLCVAVFISDTGQLSANVFVWSCGLVFSAGLLFSNTILKLVSFGNDEHMFIHFILTAEMKITQFIGYSFITVAAIQGILLGRLFVN